MNTIKRWALAIPLAVTLSISILFGMYVLIGLSTDCPGTAGVHHDGC